MLNNSVQDQVKKIIERVAQKGDRALGFYVQKFDKTRLPAHQFLVTKDEIKEAFKKIDPDLKKALLEAKKRIVSFHQKELSVIKKVWILNNGGISVGQKAVPLNRVGIYVPGGRTCYPSTVLMTAIPAKVAGVKEVVMVTPPNNLRNEILAAAYIAGVDISFRVGGPAAIAALAYGTKTIPKVDKIVGPGNRYVTEAKRQLFGVVGIDGLAGPSEVAACADESSNVTKIALNLLAQTEHDPDAIAYLVATNKNVLQKVSAQVLDLLKKKPVGFKPNIRYETVRSKSEMIARVNEIAPEHLLLAVRNPKSFVAEIKNAGAIFLGENTPVPLGDYAAGPSHVLPTGKTALFSSGLSVKDFLKWSSLIETRSKKALKTFKAAQKLASVENLYYHALSLEPSNLFR